MQISKKEIEAVKRSHDLVSVVESHGIKLRKKGSNYVGLCPFHEEKTPSFTVNPKTNLYHCFGCNAGGDVIGFVTKKEGIGFREAYERLRTQSTDHRRQTKDRRQSNEPRTQTKTSELHNSMNSTNSKTRLLNRVVSFYHKSFCEDQRALQYLQSRGITDNSIFADFQIGYSNGTLLNTIPDEGDIHNLLKEIGLLNDKGNEMFYGCVVFPVFDENKDCVGLYGRRIEDRTKSTDDRQQTIARVLNSINSMNSPTHLYLPGPRKGVFNHQAAKRSKSIILTESIIDALTLYNAGFKDVIPCYGVNGLTEDHLNLFARHQTKEIYICFDRDDAGEQGAERIKEQLKEKNIVSYIVRLPESSESKTDINSFFLSSKDAAVIFERLLKESNSRASIRSDRLIKQETRHYEKTDTGFVVQYGERRYEAKGITREGV
ncbi:MAG: toprim domain-containing protein, partial [Nitrospirae bacterium]|nr:toprim domain-containing protein [Nitrospirota bacterium]